MLFYDRSALIQRAVDTLKRALIEEVLVVTAVKVVFLLNVRSVLIVTIPLPLAVLIAFIFMRYLGISSNIMSLAGIAIAIGVLVDAAIVVTENCFRLLEQRGVDPRDRARVLATVLEASRMVGRPIFFSMAIILLAFIPVFALTGQEASSSTRWPSPRPSRWPARRSCQSRSSPCCAPCSSGGASEAKNATP